MEKKGAVLLIFTGGTVSMGEDPDTQALVPLDSTQVLGFIPELEMLNVTISSVSFDPLIDSSDVMPDTWIRIANLIKKHYTQFDGFVVLHGTDTMAYSASALSFMLEHLTKPVIFTGSQLPVGVLRSDAKENLITAIEIAAAQTANGHARVPEVCLYFEDQLMRGNRTTKRNTEEFDAFASFNYPELAKSGVHIRYFPANCHYEPVNQPLILHTGLDPNIAILKIFPGISEKTVAALLHTDGLKGVVLESFGAGNAPSCDWLYKQLKMADERGIVTVNVSQCRAGAVEMGRYQTSINLLKAGVVSGYDMTVEAAITKLMYLFGTFSDTKEIKRQLAISLRGEMTV
ncbi:MAG: type I asparaginase [Prevotellaceae bacterium]|jgi:L-asparaginase|nr:type I asparaginase [Prevotellaceae bacterium]